MLIFGLDIGTTSVGFAVIEHDEAREAGKILRLGVRIFPEARDPDGTPLNQQRRAKRMMRRQLRRRRARRRSLNELLAAHGLLPAFGGAEWARVMGGDPYALRSRGLGERLEPYELGRALYHLPKRRHFRERDLAESEEKGQGQTEGGGGGGGEDPRRLCRRAEQERANARAGARTAPAGERKRGVHATRAVVEEEFDRLCAAQAPHHPALRERAFRGALHEAIFAQRPVFWRKSTLGACRFFPGEPLCPKGSWLSQQRVMLEKLNNLAIAGGNARPLDAEERAAILAGLATQKGMGWPGVRKALEPIFKKRDEGTKYVRFNLEYGDEKGGLKGNLVEADLAKIFGPAWESHPRKAALRECLPRALWEADYGEVGTQRVVIRPETERASRRAALAGRLREEFGASEAQAEALTKLHFPQGWEPFSARALEIFLPELEKGERFGVLLNAPEREAWRDEHFPDRERPTGEIVDRLPTPKDRDEARRQAQVRNPTVVRVQNEMRKVVNNLIGLYGKPDLIRIELARQIGKSKREREEMSAAIRRNEREREKARADLKANGLPDPSDPDIEKWLLWKECGQECPYSGRSIGFDALFSGNPQFQVEHIWPRSKSLDNSFRNKTLCEVALNKEKGNRTPYEYFRTRPAKEWEDVKLRVDKLVKAKLWSPGKAKRFLAEKIDDDFAARQLNDTSYAARQAMAFLKRLWPDAGPSAPVHVQAVTGRVTAQLRKRWGLNNILADDGEKTRADHRHHAIDALVVACAHGGYTQKLSHYLELADGYERGRGARPDEAEVPPPWPSIRADAQAAVDAIVVSHRVRKKVSGPLHLETTYGDTGLDATTKSGTYRLFVTRKPVERLSKSELPDIVDDEVRRIVTDWVAAHGGEPKKAFAEKPRVGAEKGRVVRKVRLRSKQQISLMAPASTGYADLGQNHHVAIYRLPDGKIMHDVVSLFEASRRLARREPVVRKQNGQGATFVMSLAPGDTLHFRFRKARGLLGGSGRLGGGPHRAQSR